jgi:hypothetical protein
MKRKRYLIGIFIALMLVLVLISPASAQVHPANVDAKLAPGQSMTVIKEVTTPRVPPIIDIFLLEDETGSFADDVGNMKALAPDIWDAIAAEAVDFTMGVGGFRDFAQDDWGAPGDHVYRLLQDLTPDRATFVAGVAALTAAEGADYPEAYLEALHYLATPGHPAIDSNGDGDTDDPNDTPMGLQPTWRPGAMRVVLLATDAECHVTGDPPAPGWPGDAGTTSAAVTANILKGANITLIGLTPLGAGEITCVDTLASITGGSVQATTDTGEKVMEAILAGLEELTTDVWFEVTTDPGLSVELSPAVQYDVPGGSTITFEETITVDRAAPKCETLEATVTFYANEYPAQGGVIGVEKISVYVMPVVGGEIAEENTFLVAAPWIAVAAIVVGGSVVILRRKLFPKAE